MIKHCESEKEKIASNCTRGLGFFVGNLAGREHSVDLQACLASVMRNLQHPVLKVRTNSTRTLLGMREQLQPAQISELVAVL